MGSTFTQCMTELGSNILGCSFPQKYKSVCENEGEVVINQRWPDVSSLWLLCSSHIFSQKKHSWFVDKLLCGKLCT